MPNSKLTRIVLVNEFSDKNCPVTKLVYDLGETLGLDDDTVVVQANLRTRYRPGGIQVVRVLSLLAAHVVLPLIILAQYFFACFRREVFHVVVTTLPPLLHLNVTVISHIFGIDCVVWYQDAHPEIEIRILRKYRLHALADILGAINRRILKVSRKIVVLDDAMKTLIARDTNPRQTKIVVAPPWITFIEPPKPMRSFQKDFGDSIKLFYAGHYGFVHDLSPLANRLGELAPAIREKVAVTGIGMNDKARRSFTKTFEKSGIHVQTLPRLESFEALLTMFDHFDFGIVSLRQDYAGVATPSKAFSYLSQGLPILYVGPPHTLSEQLCSEGFGYTENSFIAMLLSEHFESVPMAGHSLPHPKEPSIRLMKEIIYASSR